MTANGVTRLYVFEPGETMTGKSYETKILPIYLEAINDPSLIRNKNKASLMQDSAPCHVIRSVINKIRNTYPNSWTKGFWPSNSPDFNVIEHVWSVLQELVLVETVPRTREELVARVEQKWYSLDKNYLKNLVHSFPRRIEQAINREGKNTDY